MSDLSPVTVIGCGLIAVGITWRLLVARRDHRQLVAALAAPEAADRVAAVRAATSRGLDRCASALLALTQTERDDAVLDAVAEAVALRQWEPADRASVLELRSWAGQRMVDRGGAVRRFGPATTRLADMGGPTRQFLGNAGVTGDRTLDATIAEVRALCTRLGAERAEFIIDGQHLRMTKQDSTELASDVAARVLDHVGARGPLGGYDVAIEANDTP